MLNKSAPTPLYLLRLELKDSKGNVLSINDYWETDGNEGSFLAFNKMPKANLRINATRARHASTSLSNRASLLHEITGYLWYLDTNEIESVEL